MPESSLASLDSTPDKLYKGRSQEKTLPRWLELLLLLSPLNGARSVLTARTRCSVLDTVAQRLGVLLVAVFIACSQRSRSVSKPAKQNLGQVTTIVLSGTRGPSLFLVIREGLGSGVRLGACISQECSFADLDSGTSLRTRSAGVLPLSARWGRSSLYSASDRFSFRARSFLCRTRFPR
jgi:hypothetical protein